MTRIKERVEEKEGIPPAQQRLIFGGKQMADEKTAADFNIEGTYCGMIRDKVTVKVDPCCIWYWL